MNPVTLDNGNNFAIREYVVPLLQPVNVLAPPFVGLKRADVVDEICLGDGDIHARPPSELTDDVATSNILGELFDPTFIPTPLVASQVRGVEVTTGSTLTLTHVNFALFASCVFGGRVAGGMN